MSTSRAPRIDLPPLFGQWKFFEAPPKASGSTAKFQTIWEDVFGRLKVARAIDQISLHYRLDFGPDLLVDLYPHDHLIQSESGARYRDFDDFLVEQILPRVLAHGGDFIVHASAVVVEGGAVVLLGGSGHGKSTLAASFLQSNFPLLGDDAMVISWQGDKPLVKSTYPSLRLLPDSIANVCPDRTKSKVVARAGGKSRMRLADEAHCSDQMMPIALLIAIALEPSEEICLRRLTSAESCMLLIENSFSLDPTDISRARVKLDQASAVANQVPAFEITYPRDFNRLNEVHCAIIELCRGEVE